ncbi:MAG: hypothetical protein EA397_02405 [Deltaproteobacteria bacterium]|nr:MAG: hypothetical protein EA397_02405 [Deltaproteobacteria bacterium]
MNRLTLLALSALTLAACRGETEDSAVETGTETAEGYCGDGIVDEGEECDDGEDNGPDANCFEDCTANTTQTLDVSGEEIIEEAGLDAVGVQDDDAPAGTGAWQPSGEGEQAKFNLMIPMFDFSDLIDPNLLEDAPWRPPEGWLGDIAVSEIEEISYWTKTPEGEGGTPIYLVLYTQPDGVDDHATWFGHRLTGRKSELGTDVDDGGVWVKWTISDAGKQIVFIDQPVVGTFSGPDLPTLPELVDDTSFDWNSVDEVWPQTSIDYGSELMRYVSIQTGSGSTTTDTQTLLDLIEIKLTDGRSLVIDLEP